MQEEIIESCVKLLRSTLKAMPSKEADVVVGAVADILDQLVSRKE